MNLRKLQVPFSYDYTVSEGQEGYVLDACSKFRLGRNVGRVVNALGQPIDGKGDIKTTHSIP